MIVMLFTKCLIVHIYKYVDTIFVVHKIAVKSSLVLDWYHHLSYISLVIIGPVAFPFLTCSFWLHDLDTILHNQKNIIICPRAVSGRNNLKVPMWFPLFRRNPLVFPVFNKIEICVGIPKLMKWDEYLADYFTLKLYHMTDYMELLQ